MISIVIIFATTLVFGIIIAKPKWGSFLIWPILFVYPHAWWYYHQFLPLNIGVDDLFCIGLFLVVLIRRNLLGKIPIRFGYAFWVVSFFAIVAAISTIAGSRDAPFFERILYIKDLLKLSIYWCLFFAVLHCIDDVRDLRIQFTMFSVAAVIGASLVIAQYFFPYLAEIFSPPALLEAGPIVYRGRSMGAFMNANVAACILGCSCMLVITAIRLQRKVFSKMVVYSFLFILFLGIMATRSRAGLMALVGGLLLMAFWGRSKKVAWLMILAALVIVFTFGTLKEQYTERVRRAYDPSTGIVGPNVAGRFRTWASYFETATPGIYIFGQGFRQGMERNGMESHNVYVSLITVYGIGGVIWAVFALTYFVRKITRLRHDPNPLISTVSAGAMWALIVWGIFGMTADVLNSSYARYLLFYLVVIVDRAYFISKQQQELLMYEEEVSYPAECALGAQVY